MSDKSWYLVESLADIVIGVVESANVKKDVLARE